MRAKDNFRIIYIALVVCFLFSCVTLVFNFDINKNNNNIVIAETYEWELSLKVNGKDKISIEEYNNSKNEFGELPVDVYLVSNTSEDKVTALSIRYSFDENYIDTTSMTQDYNLINVKKGTGPRDPNYWSSLILNKKTTGMIGVVNQVDVNNIGDYVNINTIANNYIYQICFPANEITDANVSFQIKPNFGYIGVVSFQEMFYFDNGNNVLYDLSKFKLNPLQIGEPANEPNSALSTLKVEGTGAENTTVDFTNTFAPTTTSYNINIPYYTANQKNLLISTEQQKITGVTTQITATGASYNSTTKQLTNITNGAVLTITVTDALTPSTPTVYTVTIGVNAASSTNTLSSLTLLNSVGGSTVTDMIITPAFSNDIISYAITVPYNTSPPAYLTTTATHIFSSVTIDGTVGTNKSIAIPDYGTTDSHNIIVTAEDGTQKTYTVSVAKEAPVTNTAINKIVLSGSIDADYNETLKQYSYTYPETKSDSFVFKVFAYFSDSQYQKITYKKSTDAISSYSSLISGGDSPAFTIADKGGSITFNIKITAQSGAFEDYTLVVNRAKSSDTSISVINIKESLTTTNIVQDNSITGPYSILSKDTVSLTISAFGGEKTGSSTYAGTVYLSGQGITGEKEGSATIDVLSLAVGTYSYIARVVAPDGSEYSHQFKIVKKSSEAILHVITVKNDEAPNTLFDDSYKELDGNKTTYTLPYQYKVDADCYNIARIRVTLQTNSANAQISTTTSGINLVKESGQSVFVHTFTGTTLNDKSVEIRITAEDGTVVAYTLQLIRLAASSSNALENVELEGLSGYQSTNTEYETVYYDRSKTSAYFNITKGTASEFATVSVQYYLYNTPNNITTINDLSGNIVIKQTGAKTVIKINVTAQNGTTKIYTFSVVAADTDNTITEMKLVSPTDTNYLFNFNFAEDVYTYNIVVPYYIKDVYVFAKYSEYATITNATSYTGSGYYFALSKTFTVKATSEAGSEGSLYTFTITREAPKSDLTLNNLKITDSTNYIWCNEVLVTSTSLKIRVDNTVQTVTVSANAATENGSKITSGIKTYTLTQTHTPLLITVQADDGQTETYTINIYKANDIKAITNIISESNEITYHEDSYTYNLAAVSYKVSTLKLTISLQDVNSKLYINGVYYAVTSGNNVVVNLPLLVGANAFSMYVKPEYEYGENGQTYTVNVNRTSPSTICTLSSLVVTIAGDEILEVNSDVENSYELRIDGSVLGLKNIFATATNANATIVITPDSYTISRKQTKNFVIKVTAEDGVTSKTYELYVTRANNNNNITGITIDGTPQADFDPLQMLYELEVGYTKTSILLGATLQDSYATLTGAGTQSLNVGDNYFVIYATSEFGEKGAEYTIKVIRAAASENAYLASLAAVGEDGLPYAFDKVFNSLTSNYIINLDKNSTLTSFTISGQVQDIGKAKVTGLGNIPLNRALDDSIDQQITIKVTAENSLYYKDYTIRIIKPSSLSNDSSINQVTLVDEDGNTYGFVFDSAKAQQALVTIPYSVTGLTLKVTTNHSKATVSGAPLFLSVGANQTKNFTFQVTAEDGSKGTEYTISIFRKEGLNNNALNSLKVQYGTETHTFTLSESNDYTLRVNRGTGAATINASVLESDLSVILSGTEKLTSFIKAYTLTDGQTLTININVQSEKGNLRTYNVKIICANNNVDFNDISITGTDLNKTITKADFTAIDKTYSFDISYYQKNINISVIPSDIYAQAKSVNIGSITISNNLTVVKFYILADDKITQSAEYTIYITRLPASDNAFLSELSAKTQNNDELLTDLNTFAKNKTEYNIFVNRDILKVLIAANKEHQGAVITVSDLGEQILIQGIKNTYIIDVTAENGTTTKRYTINVTVKDDDNAITDIKIDGVSVGFSASQTTYTIAAPYNYDVTSANIEAFLSSSFASLLGTGNVLLKDGTNSFTVYAVSERGVEGTHYTVIINRTPVDTDNTLSSLTVTDDKGALLNYNAVFEPSQKIYTISLEANASLVYVEINATTTSLNASIISGLGKHFITEQNGTINNSIVIRVKAQDGSINEYTVIILKNSTLSSDKSIGGVQLKDINGNVYDWSFIPEQSIQTSLEISYKNTGAFIEIIPTDGNAKVFIDGKLISSGSFFELAAGTGKTFAFYVQAQDGTNGLEYKVTINRKNALTDNTLESLTYSADGATPVAINLVADSDNIYVIGVERSVNEVKFNALVNVNKLSIILESNATSFIKSLYSSGGIEQITTINVQSESGVTRSYKIKVVWANKNADLLNTTIRGNWLAETILEASNFTNKKYNFGDNLIYSEKTLNIAVNPVDSYAKVFINGTIVGNKQATITLNNGINDIIFRIESEDGKTTNEYTVSVNRLAASDVKTLKSLSVVRDGTDLLDGKFSTETFQYLIEAGRGLEQINITAITSHIGALISGDVNVISVINGSINTLKIYVTAENGDKATYTINFDTRDKDNSITDIQINGVTLEGFDQNVLSYTMSVAYPFNTESIEILVSTVNGYSLVTGNGNISLVDGAQKLKVYATSESGVKGKEYEITVTRTAADTNNYLTALSVTGEDGTEIPFLSAFDKGTNEYNIKLNATSNVTKVKVIAVKESQTANVFGADAETFYQLENIGGILTKIIDIKVVAQNGTSRTYRINIIKADSTELNSNNTITEVKLINGSKNYFTYFDPATEIQQAILLPYNVEWVNLQVIAESLKAVISGGGIYSLNAGETKNIVFYVTAENGNEGTHYSLSVTRETADENNSLESLSYEVSGVPYSLDVNQLNHTISLPEIVTKIIFQGEYPTTANATGLEKEITLSSESYNHVITVTSQSGVMNTYVITIWRKSTNVALLSIKVGGEEKLNDFQDRILSLEIPYLTQTVSVLAKAADAKATVYGNSDYTLAPGVTEKIEIYVESQAGTTGEIYTVYLTRKTADENNYLSSLTVKDNKTGTDIAFSSSFNKSVTEYHIDLTGKSQITDLLVDAVSESTFSTIKGRGITVLKSGTGQTSETITILVTAQNGSERVYNIKVTREILPAEDVTIKRLSLIGSDGVNYLGTESNALNAFVFSQTTYTVTVPYNVTIVTLNIEPNNKATVYKNPESALSLLVGSNNVTFYVQSENTLVNSEDFIINVVREQPSTDNSLKLINIDGELLENFNPETLTYNFKLPLPVINDIEAKTKTININALANHLSASVSGNINTITLSHGTNIINIVVTPESGEQDKRIYTITIELLSADNSLWDLGVNGYLFDGGVVYNKQTDIYTATVPYTVDRVEVVGTKHEKAKIYGTGYTNVLKEGINTVTVYVTSEMGVQGQSYNINIIRTQADEDATLKELTITANGNNLIFNPIFDPNVTRYIINIPNEETNVNSINISAKSNSSFATVGGTGIQILEALVDGKYHNVFKINVLAQNGNINTYTVSIYRGVTLSDNVSIGTVSLTGSNGIIYLGTSSTAKQNFSLGNTVYTVVVPHTVLSVSLSMSTIDFTDEEGNSVSAKVYGTGTKSFGNGYKVVFEAFVVSQSGANQSDKYYITVNREVPLTSDTLKSITINGELLEGFDPLVTQYRYTIPYNSASNKIILSAVVSDTTATIISGTGTFDVTGERVQSILVRAQNGSVKEYSIIFSYLSNDVRLKFLNLEGFTTENAEGNPIPYSMSFNSSKEEYTVIVDKNVKSIMLRPEVFDLNAAVRGLVKYIVGDDGVKAMITVVAQDNTTTKTYTVNILKSTALSGDTTLKSLNIDGYSLDFASDVYMYSLSVKKGIEELNVDALTSDMNAKATIIGNKTIDVGKNIVMVRVQAENGNSAVYQIIVNRQAEPDYTMTILLIIIFLLWLITAIILIIKSQQNKLKTNRTNSGYVDNNDNRTASQSSVMNGQKGTLYFYTEDEFANNDNNENDGNSSNF